MYTGTADNIDVATGMSVITSNIFVWGFAHSLLGAPCFVTAES